MKLPARFAALLLLLACSAARAEVTLCTEITAVPVVITAPGIYCLKSSLAYTGTTNAIAVGANDVVIELNGHVLDGSASSGAIGVSTYNMKNVTVRNGTIRGFRDGINLGGQGCNTAEKYLVENMRLESNVWHGAMVTGKASIVRRTTVIDTGNGTGPTGSSGSPRGLWVCGDGAQVTDNQVIDTVEVPGGSAHGIIIAGAIGAVVERNVISNSAFGPGNSTGIQLSGSTLPSSRNSAIANRVVNMRTGIAISWGGIYMDNVVGGATTPFSGGTAAGTTNFSF
jgi:hypothetical protein